VVFFGHGSPMETLGGRYAAGWADLGGRLPKPRAVLMVSAHWFVDEVAVTYGDLPRTIHDFGGFPEALYQIRYPAPGAPWLADRVIELAAPTAVRRDLDWGFDHGTWSVLRHFLPRADVPVVQLSLDRRRPPAFHYGLGRALRTLRDEGVLIAGSGDVVHNLHLAQRAAGAEPYDWATRFDTVVRETLERGDRRRLVDYPALGPDALLASPTPDHYLPLLYVLGASYDEEPAAIFNDAIEFSSISMLSATLGG
jgi:4,5-DOPA dioxygenase extradiol